MWGVEGTASQHAGGIRRRFGAVRRGEACGVAFRHTDTARRPEMVKRAAML